MTVGVVLMAYGTPATRAELRGVLHGHPPRPAADGRAAGPTRRPLRRDRARRRPLPADRPHRSAGGGAAGRARRDRTRRLPRRGRHEARRAPHRAAVAALVERGVDRLVGIVHGTARLDDVDRRVRRSCRAAAAGDVPFAAVRSWATEPAYVDFLAAEVAAAAAPRCRPTPRSCSPPTRCRSGSSPRATATRRSCAARRPRSPRSSASTRGARGRSRGSRRAARPSRGSGPTSSTVIDALAGSEARRGHRSSAPCGFVADHLEVLYDLDIEARQRADGARPRASPARRRSTTTRAVFAALADARRAGDLMSATSSSSAGASPVSPPPTRSPIGDDAAAGHGARGRRTARAARSPPRPSPGCPRSTRAPTRS